MREHINLVNTGIGFEDCKALSGLLASRPGASLSPSCVTGTDHAYWHSRSITETTKFKTSSDPTNLHAIAPINF